METIDMIKADYKYLQEFCYMISDNENSIDKGLLYQIKEFIVPDTVNRLFREWIRETRKWK